MFLKDIRQLKAFQTLVQTRSFTETAKLLHVTQAAISYSIKSLESSLHCKLFNRTGRDVSLTAEGKKLLTHSTIILQRLELAEEEIAGTQKYKSGKINLGASEAACEYILQNLLGEFQEVFPDTVIHLTPADTDHLLVMLERGEIDLAIGVEVPINKTSPYAFHKLFDDEKVFITSSSHPWTTKETLTDEDISKECIITATRHQQTKEAIDNYLQHFSMPSSQLIEVFNVDIQKKMVAMGLGVGIASPWMIVDEIRKENLIAIPIPDKPIVRSWGVMTNHDQTLSMAQQAFIGMLEESIRISEIGENLRVS